MSRVNSPDFWEALYQEKRAPWDLAGPHPVFQRLANERAFEPGAMIVLGAGRGHDARLFARHDFAVTAVDFAAEAARDMEALNSGGAPITVMQADIFDLPKTFGTKFDYLLEYTCFCAIDPARRAEYADLAAHLLKPGGTMIALAFPVWDKDGGPPYAVRPEEIIDLLSERKFELLQREDNPTDSPGPRQAFESLLVFHKL